VADGDESGVQPFELGQYDAELAVRWLRGHSL
jgi:hypothetical protein